MTDKKFKVSGVWRTGIPQRMRKKEEATPSPIGADEIPSSGGDVEGHAGNAETTDSKESHFSVASKAVGAGIKPGPSEAIGARTREAAVEQIVALAISDGEWIGRHDLEPSVVNGVRAQSLKERTDAILSLSGPTREETKP